MKKVRSVIILLMIICLLGVNTSGTYVKADQGETNSIIKINASIPYGIVKAGTKINIKTEATIDNKKISDFTYKSENTKVATVNNEGIITTVSSGEGRIKVSLKDYSDEKTWVNFIVLDKIITISGPKKYKAGKTYQLKASEKNVIWHCENLLGENAHASIDAKTGKLKVGNAGSIYVKCTSKDGKAMGAFYIYADGPKIKEQDVTLDAISIKEDKHLVSLTELLAADVLPEKVKVPYTMGNKKGKVEAPITWYFASSNEFLEKGTYVIQGMIEAPQGYFMKEGMYDQLNVKINVKFKVAQSDTRKKIVSIGAVENITITKDQHLQEYWDVIKAYYPNLMLKCILEDGSEIELPFAGISYREEYRGEVGTYTCELFPKETAGYNTGGGDEEEPAVKIKIKVKKKQTYQSQLDTLDVIAPESWVIEYVSQKSIGKKIV